MIGKDLKVGDTFLDNGRAYKVLSVNSDGTYSSKAIEAEEVTEEISVEEKKFTKTDINRMPKDDLMILAKEYGIEADTAAEVKKMLIEKLDI